MPSGRRLTAETALAVLGPHLLITNFVIPWLARWMPALALEEADPVAVPSFTSFRVRLVGNDLADPGMWVYFALLTLCFGGWVYLRRNALREWGDEILADSDLDV